MRHSSRFARPSFLLRILSVALLLLPLTKIFDRSPFTSPEYVLVLDDSPSMKERFPGFGDEVLASWKEFGGARFPIVIASDHPLPLAGKEAGEGKYSDLAAALRAAASLFTPSTEKRILLVSDGLSDEEEATETLNFLTRRKIGVFALAPPNPVRQAGVAELVLPSRVFLWEPFLVKGRIAASSKGKVTALLRRNGAEIAEAEVFVDSFGLGEVEFIQEADRVGTVRYSLELKGYGLPAVTGEVRVAKSPRLRYIGNDLVTSRNLIGLFREAGIDVAVSRPSDLLYDSDELSRDDIIILDDLPAPEISDILMEHVRSAVGTGGKGLLVIGGRKGLGSEDYRGSELEALLPVTAGHARSAGPAAAAMVIAMDTSFSMAFRGTGKNAGHSSEPRKIDVAKEGAKEVVKVVRPEDRLGIIGNSTDLFWLQPLGHVDDKESVLGQIDKVIPKGDGINFYSIVREAYRTLHGIPAPIRHLIVFADSEDIDQYEVLGVGHSYDLIRRMAGEGITLSVLAIGRPTDKDVPFLRTSALLGQGDFYLISNLRALPKYFVSEYRKLSSRNFVEEEIRPVTGEFSFVLNGVQRPLPPIAGMATLMPRDGSETPVLSDLGLPIVSIGRYGAGRTAVFASDNGYRWAPHWLGWPGAAKFWLQLLFAIAPDDRGEEMPLSPLAADPLNGRITLRHLSVGGGFPRWSRLWLHPKGGKGDNTPMEMVRTGLSEYRSLSPVPRPGFYRFSLTSDKEAGAGLADLSMHAPPPPENYPSPENWPLMERIVKESGGDWISDPADISMGTRFLGVREEVLFILVIAAGIVLLLAETVTRNILRR